MDKLYTFTAYLVLVTCIATNCTSMFPQNTRFWKDVTTTEGNTIHMNGTMAATQKAKIHVNVTILAERSTAKLCSWRKCNKTQHVPLSDTCSMKIVYRQTCNMSNACYRAIDDWVMPPCPTINDGGQRCDIAWINLVFKLKDGKQLNRTCIGPGELPCSCPPCQGTGACLRNCFKGFFRCVCEAESKNCTPPTDTMTNGTATSDTITSTTTTISSEPTIVASSGQASDTAATTKSTDTTASGTPTGTPTPGPTSGKTASDTLTGTASPASGQDTASPASGTDTASPASGTDTATPASGTDTATPGLSSGKTASGTTTDTAFAGTDEQDGSQMGVLVGGVVGGLFGGVVITVVIVFLCRACRSRRRHTEDEDGAGTKESHTYLGLIDTTSSSGKSPPGTNAVTAQVPDLIKVSAVQQASSAPSDVYDVIKEGDDNQLGVDPSVCDQGDYVDIMDDMPAAGVYSLAQAAPGMAAQGGTPQPAEYFVLEKDDPTDGDYNKLVRDGATETGTDVQGTYNRLGREGATETTTDVQDTYNRLGRDGTTETGTDVQGTYNRLGREGATETGSDVQGTYNRLVREGATGTTTDVQDTYNRLGRDGTTETGTDVQGTYNRLGREGATGTTTDVQGTYNRLGREGATGTTTDVQDTYNRLGREGATGTGTDVQGTYNRLGREGATETGTDVQDTYNRLVKDDATETGTDVQGTYNRLIRDGATETGTDVQGTYNKLGSTTYDNDNNEPGRNIGTAADYFVLETPEDTSNKLAQAAPGIAVQDGTQPSAAEYFVLEKDDPTDGDYNKLVRDGATKTTTDVQDTYNKLGSMVDDNEDNEPGGNNGTAADYFVLEKPEDTYSKLEGKRSTEEEQETYTKLGEATPKRESEPPDDPGGPSREYFILEDQT